MADGARKRTVDIGAIRREALAEREKALAIADRCHKILHVVINDNPERSAEEINDIISAYGKER